MGDPAGGVDEARLTTTRGVRRRRRLIALVRGLGASSFALWMTAFFVDVVLHLGDGALPFLGSVMTGVLALITLALASAKDGPPEPARFVRVEGTRAVVVPRFASAPADTSVSLAGAVSGFRLEATGVGVQMKDGTIHELEVPSPDTRDALFDRLSPSLERRALRMPLAEGGRFRAGGSVAGYALLLFSAGAVGLTGVDDMRQHFDFVKIVVMLLMIGTSLGSFLALWRALAKLENGEVVVGLDGVSVRSKGLTRFIPISEIVRAEAIGTSVVIERSPSLGGPVEKIVLPIACPDGQRLGRAAAVADAVNGAVERRRTHASTVGEALDRGSKTAKAWREELARAARPDADYRSTALGQQDFETLVLDAAAPPDRRVGAALALSSSARSEARELVRIALPALADEDLRASLEAAAEGEVDEARLERSMRHHGRSR